MGRIDHITAIEGLVEEYSEHTDVKMDLYLIGGGALMFYGSKLSTKDIDIIVDTEDEFKELKMLLGSIGYVDSIPTSGFEKAEFKAMMVNGDNRLDIFQSKVCGKLVLSDKMRHRSTRKASFGSINLNVCSREDILIFKSITDREGDVDDCIELIKNGDLSWPVILDEIRYQVSHGKSVWITYICEKLHIIAESGIHIPILKELDDLCDQYCERFCLERECNSHKSP